MSGLRFLLPALLLAQAAQAALPTQSEALALIFPGAKLARREHFLSAVQMAQVKQLAGTELRNPFTVEYVATREGHVLGYAFFDSHPVRTQLETAMVAVSPEGAVLRVEVIVFHEPQEYRAPAVWTKQLEGKTLKPSLSLKGDIHPLSGASLTAQALTDATRRSLALFQICHPR